VQDFAKFDINGNGALEGDECTRMARFQLGDKATDEAVEALIQEMDRNNDNRIELSEYMSKILGEDYQVIPDGDERVMGKQYCKLGEMQAKADEIYKNGSIPLICGSDDDLATALSTFWSYKGDSVLHTKPLVGKAMQQGKAAAWEAVKTQLAVAAQREGNFVLHYGNGVFDLMGTAKEADPASGESLVRAMFNAREEKDPLRFSNLDTDFIHPEFKIFLVSEFLEEDVESFFDWGPFPLASCQLLVVNEK